MVAQKISKYFKTVRLVKRIIITALALLFATSLIFLVIKYYYPKNKDITKPRKVSVSKIVQSVAEGTRLYGQDKNNQPFDIQAKEIVLSANKKVEMLNIEANQQLDSGKNILITSDKALWDQQDNIIQMLGNITISYNDAYKLNVQKAKINYNESIIEGDLQVILNTKFGKVESNNVEIIDNYNEIKFFGNRVKTTLYSGE